jgi:hypothetical protein
MKQKKEEFKLLIDKIEFNTSTTLRLKLFITLTPLNERLFKEKQHCYATIKRVLKPFIKPLHTKRIYVIEQSCSII